MLRIVWSTSSPFTVALLNEKGPYLSYLAICLLQDENEEGRKLTEEHLLNTFIQIKNGVQTFSDTQYDVADG